MEPYIHRCPNALSLRNRPFSPVFSPNTGFRKSLFDEITCHASIPPVAAPYASSSPYPPPPTDLSPRSPSDPLPSPPAAQDSPHGSLDDKPPSHHCLSVSLLQIHHRHFLLLPPPDCLKHPPWASPSTMLVQRPSRPHAPLCLADPRDASPTPAAG